MKKYIFATLLGLVMLNVTSCDDGRIYPESATTAEGKTVVMEGVLNGLDSWTSNYRVSIAGFEDANDEYASVSKVITASDIKDGKATVELSALKSDIKIVRLCILDRLRRHIVTFKEVDVSNANGQHQYVQRYSAELLQHHLRQLSRRLQPCCRRTLSHRGEEL